MHNLKIITACYGLPILVLMIFSMKYLFSDTFMPYHSVAISQEWSELSTENQSLFLALMRAAAGGWLATDLAASVFLYLMWSEKKIWLSYIVAALLLIVCLTTLLATSIVAINTPANPPIEIICISSFLVFLGFYFTTKKSRATSDT